MRVLSPDTLKFLSDISGDLQAWHAAETCERLLAPRQIVRVNPELPRRIKLDDARAAIAVLPGLADSTFESYRANITEWMRASTTPALVTEETLRGYVSSAGPLPADVEGQEVAFDGAS